jgi:DNA invertase Pin-like site-specific DNA recombinase
MTKAYFYARGSRQDQHSLQDQLDAARRFANDNGLELEEQPPVSSDSSFAPTGAVSGTDVDAGDVLRRFLADLKSSKVEKPAFLMIESVTGLSDGNPVQTAMLFKGFSWPGHHGCCLGRPTVFAA